MGSTMTAEIRALSGEDIEALVAMESANQPRPWSESVFNDEIETDSRIYLGVVEGAALYGFGGMMVSGEEAHVTNLLVAPDQRRRGYARKLMVSLIDAALERGARHLTLEVRSRNRAGISLYHRFGLAPVGVRKGYYEDDDALILWVHDIDSPGYAATLDSLR
ncbi:MAG: ribosomal protein S18-alanine N-acetyltransferase [Acidimicrobiia bacterium]